MITIHEEKCIGCGLCAADCTRDVIRIEQGKAKVGPNPCLQCWHCIAICPEKAIGSELCLDDEIVEYEETSFEVNPEHLLNLMKFRRSIRAYKETKAEPEKLDNMIAAGRFSPTGCNRQPLRYLILDEEMEEIKLLCMEELKVLAETAPNSPAIANDSVRHRFLTMAEEYRTTGRDRLFFNAPQVIAVIADTSLGGRPLLDAGIAASNMVLMACAQGLGTCYIGFFVSAAEHSPKVKERLGLKEHEIAAACFVTGYPKYQYKRTVGRNPKSVETF